MVNFNVSSFDTLKPLTFIILLFSLTLINCGGDTSPASSTSNPVITPTSGGGNTAGALVPTTLQGQWLRVDTGQKVWLGQHSNLGYTKVSNNLLEVVEGSIKYHLVRAGISNVSVSGGIILAGIVVTPTINMTNVEDPSVKTTVQADNTGQFTTSLPSGTYRVTSTASTGESVDAEVVVERDTIDLGTFNLKQASAPNFKSKIIDNEPFYFGTQLGQGTIDYTKIVRVKNLTNVNATGMQVSISSTDPYIDTYSFIPQAAGVQAGGGMDVTLSFNLKRPPTDRIVHFNLDITYYDLALTQYTWRDSVSMQLSSHPPVKLYFDVPKIVQTGNQGANGYLITPGRTLKKINATNLAGDSMLVPYIAGQSYDIVFSNPAITSETPYGIGIGVPTSNYSIQTFTNIPLNEPTNNTAALATPLALNDRHISYLHQGDIDHYKLNFDALSSPFDPHLLSTTDITAGVASTGTFTLVSQTIVTVNKNMFVLESDNLGNNFLRYYDATGSVINGGVLGQSILTGLLPFPSIKSFANYLYFSKSNPIKIYDATLVNNIALPITLAIPANLAGILPTIVDTIITDPYVYALINFSDPQNTILQTYQWTNKALPPVFISQKNIGSFWGGYPEIKVKGNRLVINDIMMGTIDIFDITNPASPIFGSRINPSGNNSYGLVQIANKKVYIYNFNAQLLRVIDASDINNIIDLGNFNLPSPLPRGYTSADFAVIGSTAYFSTGSYADSNGTTVKKSNGFQIVDISNLNNIVALASAFDPIPDPNNFPAYKITIIGNELFLSKRSGIAAYPPTIMKFQLQ